MRYMGGKFRQAKAIARTIVDGYTDGAYVEPFMGAMGSAERVIPMLAAKGCKRFVLSDASAPIVDMWTAVFNGWEPPDWVGESQYKDYSDYRHTYLDDPLFAWCGHGLSFGGKWFGGFARSGASGQDSAGMQLNQKKALLRKRDTIRPHIDLVDNLTCRDYFDSFNTQNATFYCDPPYRDRVRAHQASSGFDSDLFWQRCHDLAKVNNVYVTEFIVPPNTTTVLHSWGDTVVRHKAGAVSDGTNEVLVRVA